MRKGLICFCGAVVVFLSTFAFQALAGEYDIPDFKACEIVTGEEVAQLAGGKMLAKPLSTSHVCNYTVETETTGAESYQLSFDSPASTKTMIDIMSPEEKQEKIDGVLDVAYLGKAPMSEQVGLTALRNGKFGMWVSGDRKEVVLAIAKLAVTHLP